MDLPSIRIHGTFVVALETTRIDAQTGRELIEVVEDCLREGADAVILDYPTGTTLDFGGATAIAEASARLPTPRSLRIAGLSARARAMLRSLSFADGVELVDWWGAAVDESLPAMFSRAA